VTESAEPLNERYWYVEATSARRIVLPVDEFWTQVMSGAPTDPFVMRPGSMANVPRGVWHRIEARTPSRGVAFTAGRGTQHRPVGGRPDPEQPSAP
jgi:hypothetical protein